MSGIKVSIYPKCPRCEEGVLVPITIEIELFKDENGEKIKRITIYWRCTNENCEYTLRPSTLWQ
ncbi:MAG: hypothetical protein ACTSUJ_07730 [Candidatus Njordarchaeales archaeon]